MTNLALIGIGKIARDQHVPAIAASGQFRLAATASPDGGVDGVPAFPDIAALLASDIRLDAVAICTPPLIRHGIACTAIAAGLHVFLEKPPAATLGAVEDLVTRADRAGVSLFAAWHSHHAAGVAAARTWLADRTVRSVRIDWAEDIRQWHPGQEWILGAGGFGVFDPGINALSILTEILPDAIAMETAAIGIPEGRSAPLTAELAMRSGDAPIEAHFDFLQTGPQTWSIVVDTNDGSLTLDDGGQALAIDGVPVATAPADEYAALYRQFAGLIAERRSDVDAAPLRIVADAYLVAERVALPPFAF